uniref:Uncharacterized protein n=1 Tax=Tanacetum cinerariifolium TaxID=118510 RepID=A0A699H917_TANCI|nr:hypothetical protein [Tanacetum cinerariifolium]
MHAAEIETLKQRNVSLKNEKESLDEEVAGLQSSVSAKDLELKDLNVVVHALETTSFGLHDQVSSYERLKGQIEEFQDVQMNIVNDKVAQLDAELLEMALHLEEKFYPHLLTTISGPLGAAISHAVEKEMQDGLSTSIDHGKAVVLGETSLSFALSVTHSLVERLKENVAAKRSTLIYVWTPLVNPLSIKNLMGEAGTSDSVPATTATTTSLSTTFVSASFVPSITIEDYEIMSMDGPKDS